MRKILFLLGTFCISVFCIYKLVLIIINYPVKRRNFISFLHEHNDIETLFVIGEINDFGVEERRRVIPFKVSDWLFEKYRKTKKIEYLDFEDIYMQTGKKQVFYALAVFISFSVFIIVLSS